MAGLGLRKPEAVIHGLADLVEQNAEPLQVLHRNHQPRVVHVAGADIPIDGMNTRAANLVYKVGGRALFGHEFNVWL
jgi:hypothetical protein